MRINITTRTISKITYLLSTIVIFLSLCIIPSIGLVLKVENFKCEGCNFFYNFLVSIIAICLWSIFYAVGHFSLFPNNTNSKSKKTNRLTFIDIYLKFLKINIGDKVLQSFSIAIVIIIANLFLIRFFLYQLLKLFN